MTPSDAALRPPRSLWILGPARDLFFFVLTPLLVFPLFLLIRQRVDAGILGLYVLGFGGFGHHLPGFIRAYADRDLFRRFKFRFTVVPMALVLLCGLYSFLNLNAVVCATVAWGTWHGAMQINGFARIYDSKVKSIDSLTARLDWLLCLAWFGLVILHSSTKQFSLITQFYVSGGFLFPPAALSWFRHGWEIFTSVISVMFLFNAFRRWKAGTPPSPIKLLMMASSFAFWWYCMISTSSLILGVLMWEIFHDVQYNVLVWLYQRHRVDTGAHVGAAEKFLFRPGAWRVALYGTLILAYGYIGVASSFSDINLPEKLLLGTGVAPWLLRITMASALLHFYYDGFIWRVRDRSVRQGLGLQEGSASATAAAAAAPKTSGTGDWKWIFFLVPVACMGIVQYRGSSPDFEAQVLNLSEAIPESWFAHFLAGTYYKGEGRLDRAEADYRLTVKYNPRFAPGHVFLADLLEKRQDYPEALEQYRQAVESDPTDPLARINLGQLYLRSGEPGQAETQFQAALRADSNNASINFEMASALLTQRRFDEARTYLEKTLQASPDHSGALNYMGILDDLNGDLPNAIAYYRKALASDSSNASARQNLAAALAKLQAHH